MTDDKNPAADGNEPEPGSTEWLLAQLSGGRIDSRRERREAEAALEAAGVPIPDATTEQPTAEDAAPSEAPAAPPASPLPQTDDFAPRPAVTDERPKGRFSWDTGRVEAVDPVSTPGEADEAVARSASEEPGDAARPEGSASAPAEDASVIPFMWNLAPTHEPDPALNPPLVIPEPSSEQSDFPFPSAAPIVVPKPAARRPGADAPSDAPTPEPAPSEPAIDAPATAAHAQPDAPTATPAPLPPGTTAHEFDPFAQDLFAPAPATTPVPSVDEFTIPDERTSTAASAPTHDDAAEDTAPDATGEQHVSSDWGDIADMLGAHPETVDNAIVSPMPPVNEILPSFDAILPRGAAAEKTPEARSDEPLAPGHDVTPVDAPPFAQAPLRAQTPPPSHPGNPPVEHARGGRSLNRWLLIAAAVLLAILIAIGLFALGRAVAAGRDQAPVAATHTSTPTPSPSSASPSPTPTQTPSEDAAIAGSGPLAPGQSYQWDQLRGGECLDPFSSPWEQTFTVVDCTAPHAAQLVYTAPFSADPSAPFPGEQQISSQIGLLCSKPGVIDLNAAAAYSDVQVAAAYPVTAEQWAAGQRNYFCFVTRSSGQQFSSSIAGPGPAQ